MSEVTDEALIGCNIGDETQIGCNIGDIDICDNTLIVSTTEYPSVGYGSGVYKVYFYNL